MQKRQALESGRPGSNLSPDPWVPCSLGPADLLLASMFSFLTGGGGSNNMYLTGLWNFVKVTRIVFSKRLLNLTHLKVGKGASLVAQWLRLCLPMQGTQVWALVWEDPTCCRATKPVCHNYWACALEPVSDDYWAHVPQLLKPTRLEPMLRNKRSHRNEKPMHTATKSSPRSPQLEKACVQQWKPNAAKNKINKK